ncbi:MAG: DinB family protein [Planctomycetota bacterium]
MARDRIEHATQRMKLARSFTHHCLEDLAPEQWFWQPADGMNHIAWHVGHLAFAQYFLCLKRIRDRIEADEPLISTKFLKRYKRGSSPDPMPENNETIAELRRVVDGVFDEAMRELAKWTDEELDVPSSPPHPVFDTKLGAIEWCPQHEMMHAGQMTLLRRLMGRGPKW